MQKRRSEQTEHSLNYFSIRVVLGLCSNAHLRRQHHVNEANINPCGILLTVKALNFLLYPVASYIFLLTSSSIQKNKILQRKRCQ